MFVYKLAAFCDRYSGVGYNANILVFRIAVSFEHRFSQFRLQLSMVVGHTVQADQQALLQPLDYNLPHARHYMLWLVYFLPHFSLRFIL